MDFSATIDLIIKELTDAGDIIDDLKKYPGVPVLEAELAKLKCRSAAECIALLKTMKDIAPVQVKEFTVEKKIQNLPVVETEKPVIHEKAVAPAPEEKKPEAVPPQKAAPPAAKKAEAPKVVAREPDKAIIADKFTPPSGTFHEQLSANKSEEELAATLQAKPITSLADAIGLNDKFTFVREIFKGSQSDYNQAITRLESVDSVADAIAVIMSYKGDNEESEAVIQLLELVKRKIPSDE